MRILKFLILSFLLFNHSLSSYSQMSKDSIDIVIKQLLHDINRLPLTNILDEEQINFRSKYDLKWNGKEKKLILRDRRYNHDKTERFPDEYITEIEVPSLHVDGIFLNNYLGDSTLMLWLLTARNEKKIKGSVYFNNELRFEMYEDALGIGSWDSITSHNDLNRIKENLIKLVDYYTDWDEHDAPDYIHSFIPEINELIGLEFALLEYFEDEDNPIFFNSVIQEPALFGSARNELENREKINRYISEEFEKIGLSFSGSISGTLIISETGEVEDFVTANLNLQNVESELKNILLSMPKWEPGRHRDRNVRTTHIILMVRRDNKR